jgi:hypothetical protein
LVCALITRRWIQKFALFQRVACIADQLAKKYL